MPKKILIIVFLFSVFCFLVSLAYAQEQITITTYYPSPYGSYNELRTERMAVGYIQRSDACWDPPCSGAGVDISDVAGTRDIDLIVEGNVGIGTTTPGANLHINDQQSAGLILEADNPETNDANHPSITLRQDGGRIDATIGFGEPFPAGMQNTLRIMTHENAIAGTVGGIILGNLENEQLTILKNGNVGIGTAGPLEKLDIAKGGLLVGRNIGADPGANGEAGRIRMVSSYPGFTGGFDDALIIEKTDDDLIVEGGIVFGLATSTADNTPPTLVDGSVNPNWAVNHMPAMTIRGSGNVGIGTASPGAKLDVIGDVAGVGIHATGDICTDQGGGVCLTSAGGGLFSVSCIAGGIGGGYNTCCQINTSTGIVTCKQANDWFMNSWRITVSPFPTAAPIGRYNLALSDGIAGGSYPYCCRVNIANGTTQCKRANDWLMTGWTNVVAPF